MIRGRTHTFTVDLTERETGRRWYGQFTVRKQSWDDGPTIARKVAERTGGLYCVVDANGEPTGAGISYDEDLQARVSAKLAVLLVQKPEWFDLTDPDLHPNVVWKVAEEVANFESGYFRPMGQSSGDTGPSSTAQGSAQPSGTYAGNGLTQVVGSQVQAALDA